MLTPLHPNIVVGSSGSSSVSIVADKCNMCLIKDSIGYMCELWGLQYAQTPTLHI